MPNDTPMSPFAARAGTLRAPLSPPVAPAPVRGVEVLALPVWVVLCEALVWPAGLGFGVALFVLAGAALLWAASEVRAHTPRLLAVASLLVVTSLRLAWQPSAWCFALALALLFAFAVTVKDRHAYVPALAAGLPLSMLGAVPMALHFATSARQRATPEGLRARNLREVTVPLAVIAGFALVFTFANPLLSRAATRFFERVFSLRGLPTLSHVMFWAVSGLSVLALLRPFRTEPPVDATADDPAHSLAQTAAASASHVATARNLLIGLNALFFAHNALDAVYLWAGRLPPGIGHTQYAHEGAFWLTVALAMSTAVLGWVFHGMTREDPSSRALRVLAYVWAAQNLALSAGTFERIWKYVDFSGLTSLRLVGVAGSALVSVSFALIVWKVHFDRSLLWLVRRDLDAFVIGVALFTALPTDGWVSGFNASRIARAEFRPLLHLIQQDLSAESVEGMIPLLSHDDVQVREGVAARLFALRDALRRESRAATSWTARSLSRERALRLLSSPAIVAALEPFEEDPVRRERAASAFAQRAWRSNDQPAQRSE